MKLADDQWDLDIRESCGDLLFFPRREHLFPGPLKLMVQVHGGSLGLGLLGEGEQILSFLPIPLEGEGKRESPQLTEGSEP